MPSSIDMTSHVNTAPAWRAAPGRLAVPTIGVFDSGIGGLSVLRELRIQLPTTSMHYVADGAFAPYGERDDAYVADRSLRIARHLVSRGATVVVVACNTATAAAVQILRSTWPALAVVGVEPGIKPAMTATRNGRIGVLATPGTLASEKFQRLMQAQTSDVKVFLQPCAGLATLIETGDFESADILKAVNDFCRPLLLAGVDTVVLGCTHYAFIRPVIERAMGSNVRIIDTAEAVARHAANLYSAKLTDAAALPVIVPASLQIETTGDPEAVRTIASTMTNGSVVVDRVVLDRAT